MSLCRCVCVCLDVCKLCVCGGVFGCVCVLRLKAIIDAFDAEII